MLKIAKTGRKRPIAVGPHFKLRRYLLTGVPSLPETVDYSYKAKEVLGRMYLNDQLGDCVPAGFNHLLGVATGNAGNLYTATDNQVEQDYITIGGYVPGDPSSDQGCDEITALNYYCHHGWCNGTKGLGWLAIDANSKTEIKTSLYAFENNCFAVELPNEWVNPVPAQSGFVWDLAGEPNQKNGHFFIGVGYDPLGVKIATWGLEGTITWRAIAKYCTGPAGGSVSTILTPDILIRSVSRAPNGISWNDLIFDFDAMGGSVAIPSVTIPPIPPPTPIPAVGTVTLRQAQEWVTKGIQQNRNSVLKKDVAISAAVQALQNNWPNL